MWADAGRRLLLVLVTFSSLVAERQERLTELLEISQFLAGCCYKRCFGAFVYSSRLIQGQDMKNKESDVHGPRSTLSCDLLPYYIGSLVLSEPTQKRLSLSRMAALPAIFSM